MADKSILEQIGDGIADAFSITDKKDTEQKKIPVIKKSNGVVVPKLTKVPTITTPKDTAKKQADTHHLLQLQKRVNALESKVDKHILWVRRELVKWRKANRARLQRIETEQRNREIALQCAILCNHANHRIRKSTKQASKPKKGRIKPTVATKKKAPFYSRGRRYYTRNRNHPIRRFKR